MQLSPTKACSNTDAGLIITFADYFIRYSYQLAMKELSSPVYVIFLQKSSAILSCKQRMIMKTRRIYQQQLFTLMGTLTHWSLGNLIGSGKSELVNGVIITLVLIN